jgi:hypothetical protein
MRLYSCLMDEIAGLEPTAGELSAQVVSLMIIFFLLRFLKMFKI